MRAARVHRFGEPLQIDDVPEPTVGPDDVLLDIRHVGVNPLDVWLTQGTVAGGEQPLPFVPGVEAIGSVEGRTVLARGFGLGVRRDGFYRERAAIPAEAPIPIPDGVDPGQAAALGVAGATAWRLIGDVSDVRAGDRVLVLGASGGVGSLVVFTNRFSDGTRQFLRDAAALQPFGGRACFFSGALLGGPYSVSPWRQEHGELLDIGPHAIDIIDAALGPITGVQGHRNRHGWLGLLFEHEGGAGR